MGRSPAEQPGWQKENRFVKRSKCSSCGTARIFNITMRIRQQKEGAKKINEQQQIDSHEDPTDTKDGSMMPCIEFLHAQSPMVSSSFIQLVFFAKALRQHMNCYPLVIQPENSDVFEHINWLVFQVCTCPLKHHVSIVLFFLDHYEPMSIYGSTYINIVQQIVLIFNITIQFNDHPWPEIGRSHFAAVLGLDIRSGPKRSPSKHLSLLEDVFFSIWL